MAKKGRDAADGGLTHNPFGGLAGRAAPPASEAAPAPAPAPAAESAKPKSKGRLVLRRETKHRGGKAVVVVSGGSAIAGLDVHALAKQLKQRLGCGGTVEDEDGELEIVLAGDQAARVAEFLRAQGFRVDGVTT